MVFEAYLLAVLHLLGAADKHEWRNIDGAGTIDEYGKNRAAEEE